MSEPPPLPKPIQAAAVPPPLPKPTRPAKGLPILVIVLICFFVLLAVFALPILRTVGHWWYNSYKASHSTVASTDDSNDSATTATPTRILGHVLSVTDDGVLVEELVVPPNHGPVYFVKGQFDYVDGDSVKLDAYPAGTYKYTTALGAEKTVRAFKVRK